MRQNSKNIITDFSGQEHQPGFRYRKRKFGRTSTVFQMEVSECGAASLSMIMGYYGVHVSLELLRVQTGVSRNGVNAKNICCAAQENGFIANGYNRNTDRLLEKTAMPCIVHWDYRHFVVLEGMRFGRFYINDPASGRYSLSREEFEEHYTGIALEVIPTDDIRISKKPNTLLNYARIRLAGQGKNILILFLLGLCMVIPGALSPVLGKAFLDDVMVDRELTHAKWILLGMLLLAIYKAYFTLIRGRFTERFKSKLTVLSTDSLLTHLFKLPLVFFEQRAAGDLVQRVHNDENVMSFLTGEVVSIGISMVTSVFYFAIMLLYDIKLSLVGLLFCLLSMTAVLLSAKRISEYTQLYGLDSGKMIGAIYSGIIVSSSIKAAGAENEYASKILGHSALVAGSDQKLGRTQQVLNVIPEAISSISNIIVLILGSNLILNGSFTPGMLMAFTGFLGSFTGPFSDIVEFARGLHQLKNDMSRVDDLIQYNEDTTYSDSIDYNITEGKLKGEVELKDISFAYGSQDRPLVKGLNLKLEAGKTVALVGSSGCGKSTVAKLITSLYRPWTGEILFDGVPSDRIAREVLSRSLSIVSQNVVLFEGSIHDNITTWNDNISQSAVVAAARDACIHDDISLKPGSYDYILTTNGTNISGGQRQRIEIAKALASDPSILVLDEATSFLDTLTEKQIYENIKKRGCTCIIVAQRLSSIRDCDEIIVMKNGRVIERGSHTDLMQQKGSYYELVSKSVN